MTTTATDQPGLRELIAALPLSAEQRMVLQARWLDQVEWMSRKADLARQRYNALRLTTVIGGVIVPAMISISLGQTTPDPTLRWLTFGVSLLVAVTAAIEGFFHFGDRWRHYRGNAELLKSEGWSFVTAVGQYRKITDPEDAYKTFITRVEAILRQDVEGYLSDVVASSPSERHDIFTRV